MKVLVAYGAILLFLMLLNLAYTLFSKTSIQSWTVLMGTAKWLPLPIGIICSALGLREYMLVWKIFGVWYAISLISIPFAILWVLEFSGMMPLKHTQEQIYNGFYQACFLFLAIPGIIQLLRFAFSKESQ